MKKMESKGEGNCNMCVINITLIGMVLVIDDDQQSLSFFMNDERIENRNKYQI